MTYSSLQSTSRGYHSTSFAGEYQNPTEAHLLELAATFGLKNPTKIIAEVKEAISRWKQFAKVSGLSAY